MSMEYVAKLALGENMRGMFIEASKRPVGVYKQYLKLVRHLQEHGIPVKPLDLDSFQKVLHAGQLAAYFDELSGLTRHITKIDWKKAFFAAMAVQILLDITPNRFIHMLYVKSMPPTSWRQNYGQRTSLAQWEKYTKEL